MESKQSRGEMNNTSIIHLIRDVDRCIKDRDDVVFTRINFKPRFMKLYFDIYHNDGITQKQLAEVSKLRPPSVSTTLVQMESEGYIERKVDEEDLRKVKIYMTEKGKSLKEKISSIIDENERVLLSSLTDDEVDTLRNLLIRIKNNISKGGTN